MNPLSGIQALNFSHKVHPLTQLFSHFFMLQNCLKDLMAHNCWAASIEFLIQLGVGLRTGLFNKFPWADSAPGPRPTLSELIPYYITRKIILQGQELWLNA